MESPLDPICIVDNDNNIIQHNITEWQHRNMTKITSLYFAITKKTAHVVLVLQGKQYMSE